MQGEMRGIIMVWRFHRCHGSCTDGEHAVHVYLSMFIFLGCVWTRLSVSRACLRTVSPLSTTPPLLKRLVKRQA